jgi:hypothetical protein
MYYDAFERLYPILYRADDDAVVYVYRLDAKGKIIHPYLLKCLAWPDLLETLRDHHGGGRFRIMIRKGKTMIFTGNISIIETSPVPGISDTRAK